MENWEYVEIEGKPLPNVPTSSCTAYHSAVFHGVKSNSAWVAVGKISVFVSISCETVPSSHQTLFIMFSLHICPSWAAWSPAQICLSSASAWEGLGVVKIKHIPSLAGPACTRKLNQISDTAVCPDENTNVRGGFTCLPLCQAKPKWSPTCMSKVSKVCSMGKLQLKKKICGSQQKWQVRKSRFHPKQGNFLGLSCKKQCFE